MFITPAGFSVRNLLVALAPYVLLVAVVSTMLHLAIHLLEPAVMKSEKTDVRPQPQVWTIISNPGPYTEAHYFHLAEDVVIRSSNNGNKD